MDSSGQHGVEQLSVLVQQRKEEVRKEKDQDSGYEDFEEYEEDECVDSDMEGSIMARGRPKKPAKPPALPQRSEKRTSKLLENVMLELQNLDGSRQKEADKISIIQESDPHELYLSSEEDASFSDDYEDSLSEYEAMSPEEGEAARASSSRASSRRSQEDTARIVSFVMVGKPQIVDIYVPNTSPSRTQNRHSLNLETLVSFKSTSPTSAAKSTRRPTPLRLYPAIRRMSISSITSPRSPSSANATTTHPFAASTTNLPLTTPSNSNPPLRKSSRLASNLTSLVTNTKNTLQSASHSFLNSDPFAMTSTTSTPLGSHPQSKNREEEDTPIEPKTPTSMAAAAWKKGFSKTLSMAKRPSMPKLSLAYTAGVVIPRNNSAASNSRPNLALSPEDNQQEQEVEKEEKVSSEPEEVEAKAIHMAVRNSISSSSETSKVEEKKEPVRYEDIMKSAGEVIRSPMIPSPKERRAVVFGRLVRSRSAKERDEPQIAA
jgi:hypothetical protein